MNPCKIVYEEPRELSVEEASVLLSSSTVDNVNLALLSLALFGTDPQYALSVVLRYAYDERAAVRGTAILCLGHIARLQGDLPDSPTLEILKAGRCDASSYVRGHTESAADDIDTFIPELGRRLRAE